ncbi:hypothetical protein PZA11_007865 [Diplocarpon coronariae]|uniref:Uncharacterized protein n=1 Tax=Diplocarpon coronariae TaxID=2795749 RepID=A0A218ZD30_9HELO|nr:hypothetical protein B2J93_6251 [Marssonina coronariae]
MAKCKSCEQPLVVELDPESFDEANSPAVGQGSSAPDDLLLVCGCHFHWQCLLDESPQIALDLACPVCQRSIVTTAPGPSATNSILQPNPPQPLVLTRYHNEGGVQENLDILPLVTEEAYLVANPAARPARAFMTMCAEGDVAGIIELLKALVAEPDEGDMLPAELLRFQDPLDRMKTGLHVAIERSQQEAVWLLLWLASAAQTHAFPGEVIQAAETMDADRGTAEGVDIRGLRDEQGQTAEDVARGMGNAWAGLLSAGLLKC